MSLPLLPILMCLFLYIFSGRKSVLLVFRLSSEVVVLYVVVVLVCLKEEVKSGSSYFYHLDQEPQAALMKYF